MNQTTAHRDLDIQFGGDLHAMIEELQQCFAERLGVAWMPHPEEIQSLLDKFSAQTLLQAMRELRSHFRITGEAPASFIQEELLMVLEEKAVSINQGSDKAYELI